MHIPGLAGDSSGISASASGSCSILETFTGTGCLTPFSFVLAGTFKNRCPYLTRNFTANKKLKIYKRIKGFTFTS